jgi:hypothetical protein
VTDRLFADQGQDIFIKDLTLTICQFFEFSERGVDIGFAFHLDAQVFQALFERIATTQLAQHDLVGTPAHILRSHDLVGVTRLQYAVLVDA